MTPGDKSAVDPAPGAPSCHSCGERVAEGDDVVRLGDHVYHRRCADGPSRFSDRIATK